MLSSAKDQGHTSSTLLPNEHRNEPNDLISQMRFIIRQILAGPFFNFIKIFAVIPEKVAYPKGLKSFHFGIHRETSSQISKFCMLQILHASCASVRLH